MNTHLINTLALLLSLFLAGSLVYGWSQRDEGPNQGSDSSSRSAKGPLVISDTPPAIPSPDAAPGDLEVKDAQGRSFVARDYRRVVSLHTTADRELPRMLEADRIAAVSAYSRNQHPEGWRLSQWPFVASSKDLESILSFRPDLVIVSPLTDASVTARLREKGTEVFVLAADSGLESSYAVIETLGRLLRVQARADDLIRAYKLQALGLESRLRDKRIAPGMYLSVYGDSFFGGTRGSSYADLLRLGGVLDLAERHGHSEWPKYSLEQLVKMNPALIVTPEGGAQRICSHSGLGSIAACGPGGRIIEMQEARLSDPGSGLLRGAERLQGLLHGPPKDFE